MHGQQRIAFVICAAIGLAVCVFVLSGKPLAREEVQAPVQVLIQSETNESTTLNFHATSVVIYHGPEFEGTMLERLTPGPRNLDLLDTKSPQPRVDFERSAR